jgi:hypothetical protein
MKQSLLMTVLCVVTSGATALAAEPVYFPAKQQTAEQMEQDKTYCEGWALEQTKKSDTAAAKTPEKSGARSGAKGAAIGAAGGAIGGDAGKGAAIGALVGVVAGRSADRQAKDAKDQALSNYFYRSLAGCMEGKGYTVR